MSKIRLTLIVVQYAVDVASELARCVVSSALPVLTEPCSCWPVTLTVGMTFEIFRCRLNNVI